jgi:hypothetical protein
MEFGCVTQLQATDNSGKCEQKIDFIKGFWVAGIGLCRQKKCPKPHTAEMA